MAWLNPTAASTGRLIEIKIGTNTSGPPVPLIEERNPVTAPTISSILPEGTRAGASASCCLRSAFRPDMNVRRPRHASSNRGFTTLTAQAPANAVGVAPAHSQAAMPQSIDLFCANTVVATRPDRI